MVDVDEHRGRFVRSFGEGILEDATDITVANAERLMILDRFDPCHAFTVEGIYLSKFNINIEGDLPLYCRVAVHPAGEHACRRRW